ncbi:damage-inducible protein CinA [Sulfitobacter sp. SK012]|uniref:CinA family protein n=1 Tax=Sulfitobacter sp. SK012 TaxID=1389005 RepID=UPI000E0B81AB|nr:CinA family protein [Sulfitobacter sp. SK012]AXI46798.1 damage-inducible protein CinA [Sulfitobacter sp. SK012]
MNVAAHLLEIANQTGNMVACAESCTGGMVAAALTDLPGSSALFDRGFLTYSNAAKIDLLGVSPATLDRVGAVSEEVALEMARGTFERSAAAVAVSVTGVAGPGGSDHKPEGMVCFGIATASKTLAETQKFGALGRMNVRVAARDHALMLLLKHIEMA